MHTKWAHGGQPGGLPLQQCLHHFLLPPHTSSCQTWMTYTKCKDSQMAPEMLDSVRIQPRNLYFQSSKTILLITIGITVSSIWTLVSGPGGFRFVPNGQPRKQGPAIQDKRPMSVQEQPFFTLLLLWPLLYALGSSCP